MTLKEKIEEMGVTDSYNLLTINKGYGIYNIVSFELILEVGTYKVYKFTLDTDHPCYAGETKIEIKDGDVYNI